MGNRGIEDSLERLDKLTQEEARVASAEQLMMNRSARGVDDAVLDVDYAVRGVDDAVRGIDDSVLGVGNTVRGVDDKLDQANRLSSL